MGLEDVIAKLKNAMPKREEPIAEDYSPLGGDLGEYAYEKELEEYRKENPSEFREGENTEDRLRRKAVEKLMQEELEYRKNNKEALRERMENADKKQKRFTGASGVRG